MIQQECKISEWGDQKRGRTVGVEKGGKHRESGRCSGDRSESESLGNQEQDREDEGKERKDNKR